MTTLETLKSIREQIDEKLKEIEALEAQGRDLLKVCEKEYKQMLTAFLTPRGGRRHSLPAGLEASADDNETRTRKPRKLESRFMTGLSRIANHFQGSKQELEQKLNDAASRIAEKNNCEVPQEIWTLIDKHVSDHKTAADMPTVVEETPKKKATKKK